MICISPLCSQLCLVKEMLQTSVIDRYRMGTSQHVSRAVNEGLYWWSVSDTPITLCIAKAVTWCQSRIRIITLDGGVVGAYETSLMQYAK